ncbi:NO signaling/Golgi transport ligand-binding domain-containing protein [Gorgonomyces haynaldii]|nr:NO signaling/Golgi transport ligand-binding domain-containing protein [Gorgonomyces haynaldii]
MSRKTQILDRSLNKTRNSQVSLSAFAFLFSEMLQYTQKRVTGIQDFEKSLSEYGYRVGSKYYELLVWRERNGKRETRVLQILYFINTNVWKNLFGKQADSLEKSTDADDEFMISDNEPLVTKFISVPKEMSSLNCGAFMAGIVEAILDCSQFPCRVTAHSTGNEQFPNRTTLLIKFTAKTMQREQTFEG